MKKLTPKAQRQRDRKRKKKLKAKAEALKLLLSSIKIRPQFKSGGISQPYAAGKGGMIYNPESPNRERFVSLRRLKEILPTPAITDTFGGAYPKYCPDCGGLMQIVRPGDARCSEECWAKD